MLNAGGGLVSVASFEGQKIFDNAALPLVLKGTFSSSSSAANVDRSNNALSLRDTVNWIRENQQEIVSLLDKHGAILFRDFPIHQAEDLNAFVDAFQGWRDLPYEDSLSYAVRLKVCERVCTTNEGKTGGMVFHHEQAQAPKFPTKLFFYCHTPAAIGGATAICPSHEVLRRLEDKYPEFVKSCEEKGVIYFATLPPAQDASKGAGRSWKSFFGCSTKEDVERRMTELGYSWEWLPNDVLRTKTPVLPAVLAAPGSGKRVFFNQMAAQWTGNAKEFSRQTEEEGKEEEKKAALNVSDYLVFGDGSPVDTEALEFADRVCAETAVELDWQKGDVLLIDNYQVMHARRAFDGPRKVYASLVQ